MLSSTTAITEAAAGYSVAKGQIELWTGASQELLHVHFGLLIFVLAALLLRKKFRSPVPLALVTFFAVFNEIMDWIDGPAPNQLEPSWDVLNTVFWPAILFLLARRWR